MPPTTATRDDGGLLRATPVLPQGLNADARLRYKAAAKYLDRLCGHLGRPARLLEVGCNVLDLLPGHFRPDAVTVTRCDLHESGAKNYVRIEAGRPLPFADGEFDAVVALEVLEHIPAGGRRAFLHECLRVAAVGCIWSCPNGAAAVEQAERLGAEAYRVRNGREHPFLSEHAEFGLPREAEVAGHLRDAGVPFAVVGQVPVGDWLAGLAGDEALTEAGQPAAVREPAAAAPGVPYRKFYVASHGGTGLPVSAGDAPEGIDPAAAALAGLGRSLAATAKRLTAERADAESRWREQLESQNIDLRREREEHQAAQEALLDEWERQWEAIRDEYQEAIAQRDAVRRDVAAWRLRHRVTDEALRDVSTGVLPALLKPLRWLGRKLIPRAVRGDRLTPWAELKQHEGGEWESLGGDPQFVLPGLLPAGWARLRLRLTGGGGRAEVYADCGGGFAPDTLIEAFDWDGEFELDAVVRLPAVCRALRVDPLDAPGKFRLEGCSIQSLPPAQAAWHALARKWRLLRDYKCLGRTVRRGLGMLFTGRWGGAAGKLYRAFPDDRELGEANRRQARTTYEAWQLRHALTDADRRRMRDEAAAWESPPVISLIVPVYNTPAEYLTPMIESVLKQTYPHWQLCLTDDGSTAPHVRPILERYAKKDGRIDVAFRPKNGGISAASNDSLARAAGDFVALLDHDDLLAEHALFRFAEAARGHPGADFLYSDEDKITPDGERRDPFFKPDWTPEFFLSCMYTCHLGVYRTSLARAVGGFRSEYDFAQDYDLALRVVSDIQGRTRRADGTSDESSRVVHIPDVLYHWRLAEDSTSTGHEAKPQAAQAARRAVDDYLRRAGRAGRCEIGPGPGLQRVRYDIVGKPLVSVVIPTACKKAAVRGEEGWLVERCVESVRRKTGYDNYEIVVIDNDDMPAELGRRLDGLGTRRLSFTKKFNLAEKINLGAERAAGEYLLLLNDDIEVITPGWMTAMLEYAQWPEVGAVGAKLFFENGHLQHAGVTFVGELPFHHFYNHPGGHPGYWGGNVLIRNYSAVTGACMMVRASVYREVGGFDPAFPLNFNDVDFCMKLLDTRRRIVMQPNAQLYHFEAVSKAGTFVEEIERFLGRWGDRWACDPLYSPHLTKREYDYRLGE